MKKVFMLATLATAMLASTVAQADRDGDHHGKAYQHGEMKYEHHDHHEDDDDKYSDKKRYKKAPPPHARAWGHSSRQFQRGDILPKEYRSERYYVKDWRSNNLSEPPVGYQWTEADGKYLLVSMANNAISKVVYGR